MKGIKSFSILLIDILLINISFLFSLYVRFSINMSYKLLFEFLNIMPFIVMFYIISFYMFRAYKIIWKLATIDEVITILLSCISGGVLNLIFITKIVNDIDVAIIIMSTILIFLLTLGFRLSYRFYKKIFSYISLFKLGFGKRKKALIIGAGYCGRIVIEEFKKYKCKEYKCIGLIDDNKNKIKTYLGGIKVLGTRESIEEIVLNKNVELIIIAIPSLEYKDKKEIIEICHRTQAKVKIMPSIYELINEQINLENIRDVNLRDLLGREQIILDKEGIKEYIGATCC
ncbi:MAG: nucleoside-diphosphate sugar epimerase/dehydratase [Clostridium sp.]